MKTNVSSEIRSGKGELGSFLNSLFLLKLLYVYQGIISSRPIEMGNREFLECMLSASGKIAASLELSCVSKVTLFEKLVPICRLIKEQTVANSKTKAVEILKLVSALMTENRRKRPDQKVYLQTPLPAFTSNYKNINIIFGPGLGLGDQITFFPFLNKLSLHCPGSQLQIYTLYPGLWRTLLPAAREIQYREKPLRPFFKLAKSDNLQEQPPELFIIADFDSFNFQEDIAGVSGRDVLEIALGKACAWFTQYDSPWIKFEILSTPHTVGKNYWILSELAGKLFPSTQNYPAWQPFVKRPLLRGKDGKLSIFLNPFTSKKYELQVEDWYQLLSLIYAKLRELTEWNVVVFSGLNEQSLEFATRLVKHCQNGSPRIQARILQSADRKLPTVFNTFDYLSKELDAGICITVDTFTGHLMPLYGITTLVITDRDNKAFWVPARKSYYCLLGRMKLALPLLLANLLIAEVQVGLFNTDRNEVINELAMITEKATRQGIDHTGMAKVQQLLFSVLQKLPDTFPYKDQGNRWLINWGQLVWAMTKDSVPAESTIASVQTWQQSEFFKFITTTKDY